MVRRSSKKTKRFRGSPRNKHLCDLKPRSKYCKGKEDKKVKPYSGGKLNVDEICHNCTEGTYAKGARRFCKTHGKIWDPKSNSCRKKKTVKSGTKPGTKSTKIKYNKYTECLEECKLKHKYSINKNKKHVCKDQCRIYKTIKIKTSKIDNKKKSSEIKPKKQKGGALCLPCISPILSGLGVLGAGAAATVAGAGAMTMTSSKMSQSGNNIEREQSFEKKTSRTHKKSKKSKKSEEKLKFHITQKNNKVTYKRNNEKMKTKVFKSKNRKDNINKATNFYNKKIEYCAIKGYKKCLK